MTSIYGRPLSWISLKEDKGNLTKMQNITSSLLKSLIRGKYSLKFYKRNMIYNFRLKTGKLYRGIN